MATDLESPHPDAAPTPAWDFRFSTEDFPAPDRFEAWRDVSRRVVGVEASSDAASSFAGEFAGFALGAVTFVRSTSAMSWYERTRALADESDEVSLSFLGGRHNIAMPGGDLVVPAGGAALLAHDRRFTLAQSETRDTSYHFVLERNRIRDLLPAGVELGVQQAVADGAILSLLRGYVPTLAAMSGTIEDPVRDTIGGHVADLVAMLYGPHPDARPLIEDRGVKAARTKAVLDLVARSFARPDLSAESIGRALGISARQVHRLLEETPKSLHEHVLEARLCRAHDLLSDPFGPALAIAEIARSCGFADPAHFSRSFRTRFGDTPSGVRADAARRAISVMRVPAAS